MSDGGGLGEHPYLEVMGGPLDGLLIPDEGQDLQALQCAEISHALMAGSPIRTDDAWGLFERCDDGHLHWLGWYAENDLPEGGEDKRPGQPGPGLQFD